MMFTDMNNRMYATAVSAMIQEHLALIEEGEHAILEGASNCIMCSKIRMMHAAGTLDGIITVGFWDHDYRNSKYSENRSAVFTWWDWVDDVVNEEWLKVFVFPKALSRS